MSVRIYTRFVFFLCPVLLSSLRLAFFLSLDFDPRLAMAKYFLTFGIFSWEAIFGGPWQSGRVYVVGPTWWKEKAAE